jgi:hypothetical protein
MIGESYANYCVEHPSQEVIPETVDTGIGVFEEFDRQPIK